MAETEINVNDLINDEFSCVKHIRKSIHISLPPAYIGKEHKGVLDIFKDWLYNYVKSLNGILLKFMNVSFLQHKGSIITDQPYIHRDVSADFYVFQPSPGAILKGVVNKVSKKHISCLVHGGINVSLGCPSNFLNLVSIGQEILFQVESVERFRRMRVIGRITELSFEGVSESPEKRVEHEKVNGYSAADDAPLVDSDSSVNSTETRKKQKKRKKKGKEYPSVTEESLVLESDLSMNSKRKKKKRKKESGDYSSLTESDTPMNSKHKKRKRKKEGSDYSSLTEETFVLESDSSLHSKRKNKKRKCDENKMNSSVNELETSKSKMKRTIKLEET